MRTLPLIIVPALLLSGCVSAVTSVVTAPFKVAGQAADWATTSQDEADRNRGRRLRKAEAEAYRTCRREADGPSRADCMRDRMHRAGF